MSRARIAPVCSGPFGLRCGLWTIVGVRAMHSMCVQNVSEPVSNVIQSLGKHTVDFVRLPADDVVM